MNNLQLYIKQMLGEIDVEKLILHNANEKKRLMVKVKAPIIYKCYAHIMNNGNIGMSRKNKTANSDMNIKLIFNGNTKQLMEVSLI